MFRVDPIENRVDVFLAHAFRLVLGPVSLAAVNTEQGVSVRVSHRQRATGKRLDGSGKLPTYNTLSYGRRSTACLRRE